MADKKGSESKSESGKGVTPDDLSKDFRSNAVSTLVTTLLSLPHDTLLGCTKDMNELKELLRYARHSLEGKLEADWEASSHLLALLNEVDDELKRTPHGSYQYLKDEVLLALHWLKNVRHGIWLARRKRLRDTIELAQLNLERLVRECEYLDGIVFAGKVLAFCHAVEIPCRLQLPSTVSKSLGEGVTSPVTSPITPSSKKQAQHFSCTSVDGFTAEFVQYENSLSIQRDVAAQLYHTFLKIAERICARDVAFTTYTASQRFDRKKFKKQEEEITVIGADGSEAPRPEVQRAMDLIEQYICSRLFRVMFPTDQSKESQDDEALFWKMKNLTWVKPYHLSINIPADPAIWTRSVDATARLDSVRSPKQKLDCLTSAIKWLAKMLEVKAAISGYDADTALSALIYVILKTCPRRLRSNITFIETFLPPEKLVGEGVYCLTQFNLAVSYINDTLSEMDKKSLEEQLRKGVVIKSTKKAKLTDISVIMAVAKLSDKILTCLPNKDIFRSVTLVNKHWKDCCQRITQERKAISVLSGEEEKSVGNSEPGRSLGDGVSGGGAGSGGDSPSPGRVEGKKAVTLETLLSNSDEAQKLLSFCTSLFCDEYLQFYLDVEKYRKLANGSKEQSESASHIYDKYVKPGAEFEIATQPNLRAFIKSSIFKEKFERDASGDAEAEILAAVGTIPSLTSDTFNLLRDRVANMIRTEVLPKYAGGNSSSAPSSAAPAAAS